MISALDERRVVKPGQWLQMCGGRFDSNGAGSGLTGIGLLLTETDVGRCQEKYRLSCIHQQSSGIFTINRFVP
jgi:hypothetical protein